MTNPASAQRRVRFGTFEFDLATRELRRAGELVKLQDQPSRMLAIMVERAGELVSREEFRNELWPNGTFVEFDHSLNTAVRKLRQALGDDPEHPSFVETVPRSGYRFIAEVEQVCMNPDVPGGTESNLARSRDRWILLVGFGLVGALAVAMASLWHDHRSGTSPAPMLLNLTRLTADAGLTWQPAISRDGQLIAYSSDRGQEGNLDIWVTQVHGSDPIRLTDSAADDLEPDFCPDGRIVFRSDREEGGVYVVPALGGSAVLLAARGHNPRCSPDGKWVAFSVGSEYSYWESAVYVVPSTGGRPIRIAPQLARCRSPLWSDDSTKLLLFGYPDRTTPWNQAEWYLAPIGAGAPARLDVRAALGPRLRFPVGAPQPAAWVAGTGEVLFSASTGQQDYATTQANLWSVMVDSRTATVRGPARQITASPGLHVFPAAASGGTIVFADVDLNPDIWASTIDHGRAAVTGRLQRITTDKYWESRPSVSPDESTFVFRTDRDGGWDFWQMDLRTSRAKPITISRDAKVFPALSKDSTRVAWNTGSAVYIAELRTGAARQLCGDCGAEPSDWTNDGRLIVSLPARSAIGIMSAENGSIQEIIRPTATTVAGAAMSPDGHFIAFTSAIERPDHSGDGKLIIAPANRLPVPQESWTEVAADASVPHWSPDGGGLYFVSAADGWSCVWVARIDRTSGKPAGRAEPVMHFHQRRYPLKGSYAVSSKRLFVGLHDTTANIWIGRREEK